MPFYRYPELEVIGCEGSLAPQEIPALFAPVYAIKNRGAVLVPPYRKTAAGIIARRKLARVAFEAAAASDDATLLPQTAPACADHALFLAEDTTTLAYISFTECHARLTRFADARRAQGDAFFRAGQQSEALEPWSLAADVSQENRDYARVLLCLSPANASKRMKRLRKWITKQGQDPDVLCARLRAELAQ